MVKRWIAVTLAGGMAVSLLAGCGKKASVSDGVAVEVKKEGYPVADQPIHLEGVGFGDPGAGEWNDFPIFKDISDQTNVTVNFQTVTGDSADEKLNLILASKTLPDVIFSGLSDQKILSYAQKGILIPIEGLIENYAPNIKKELDDNPDIRKAITTPDGHIYAVPSVNEDEKPVQSTTLNINKGWLDKLGLKTPATTDEFEAVLKAFKDDDPNGNGAADEIPFTYEPTKDYSIWNGDTGLSGAFGVTDSSSYMMRQGDKLVFTPALDGWKDYVKWTAKLYGEGLIDLEVFTQDHNQYMSKISSDRVGAYLTNGPVKTPNADYIAIKPLKGPNGDQLWSSLDFSIDKNRGVITSANKYPEATMRYMDSFYEPMNSLKLRYGVYLKPEGDKFEVLPSVPGKSPEAPGSYVGTCIPKVLSDKYIVKTQDILESDERKAMYAPFLAQPVPLLNFTNDESKELSSLTVDLAKIVDENKARWTTNQADIDKDWDGYIQSLKNVGLDRYVEIYNTALDRYLKTNQ